ncbi:MAG: 50S ribosomal protein L9 [candidate division Zixibacteria bacterium]|nr:50S ribosomal protein L9 [candidate division Zixibacteria bacterium]MDH3936738.1 50S ribosomal protein L9 [candidate division Zixibacteria bacterium]MDH4032677.1 50S ribosomal protein L9 [candidate division Zixibacteria bacterium]
MKVILREDVADIGQAGQTVEVKDGYGRNYLIPRNLAIVASKGNLRSIGEVTKQKELRERKLRREAEVVKEKIEKLELSAEVLVGEEDKVFGSVTVHDIVELLSTEGITVPKHTVKLDEPIKVLGVYTVPIKIEKDVTAELKLWVVKKT